MKKKIKYWFTYLKLITRYGNKSYIKEQAEFIANYNKKLTINNFLSDWAKSPSTYFHGYYDRELAWSVSSGRGDLSPPKGYCTLPNIRCQYPHNEFGLTIGFVEDIHMFQGVVVIKHFALTNDLTHYKIGHTFYKKIIQFMKDMNAIEVHFHENHRKKIDHYRAFFRKINIPEEPNRVWKVNLYPDGNIPDQVNEYQADLLK